MHEHAERLAGSLVMADHELEREFEARLADSSRLAFRVAFSVLKQREDAEDVVGVLAAGAVAGDPSWAGGEDLVLVVAERHTARTAS